MIILRSCLSGTRYLAQALPDNHSHSAQLPLSLHVHAASPHIHPLRLSPNRKQAFFWLRLASVRSVLDNQIVKQLLLISLRKEVIQPHLPIRLPCYDFTPVTGSTFGSSLLAVGSLTSGISDSHGVTGGVYKTRERIHRSILICDY